MKYFKKLEGCNVYLSPINEDDAYVYTKWMNDFSVTDGLGKSHMLTNINCERDWIIENNKKGTLQFAIVKKRIIL